MSWLFPSPVQNNAITPSQVREHMQPVQQSIDKMGLAHKEMQGFGEGMMNPMSQRNLQQRQMFEQQSMEQMALQNLLARREAAATGQDSAFTSAQRMMGTQQMGRDVNQQWMQGENQRYMQGMNQYNQSQGLLSNMMSGQLGIQENVAQSDIARRQSEMDASIADRQMNQQGIMGLFGGLLGAMGQST